MASSQFTIPVDVTRDTESLKRLLVDLASVLDAVTGVVADDAITSITSIDAITTQLRETTTSITKLISSADSRIKVVEKAATATSSTTFKHLAIATATYKDFDALAWATLLGLAQFTELGSNLVNAPFVPVPATSYTFYIESYLTVGGGIVQRLLTEDAGPTLTAYYRTGDTFATALTNGWTAL